MNTKTMKILVAVLTAVLMIAMATTTVLGLTPGDVTVVEPTDPAITDLGGKIIGILQTVGVVIAIIILAILGIKYMMGSAEEKAEYKKTFIPYIVGAILIFAAPAIANMVYNMVTNLS